MLRTHLQLHAAALSLSRTRARAQREREREREEGAFGVFSTAKALTVLQASSHMQAPIATKISQGPGTANRNSTRTVYRSGCMTGSAIFCHFHSDTVRDTAGPVRPGQEKIFVSPRWAFSLVPSHV